MAMKVITEEDVRRHVPFAVVLSAIESAFIALDAGRSTVFEVVRGAGGGENHFFGIKSGRDGSIPMLGVKAGSYVPGNAGRGLPAHSSTTMLIDDLTGQPVAVVQADYLNGLRTSAANTLAVRELARADASTLGIIGIGGQAVFEVLAVAHVRPIQRILAVGRDADRRRAFEQLVREKLDVRIEFVSAEVAAREADVLVTVTPSRAPLVRADWIRPGTHISAMGADNVGKQELDPALFERASLWVDHPDQAARIGEAQHAVNAGSRTVDQLREQTLGGLLSGRSAKPRDKNLVTVLDSSGLAVQDIAAAYAAYQVVSGRIGSA